MKSTNKATFNTYKNDDDSGADDIQEDIQSEHEPYNPGSKFGAADSESGRGFGITVSQSLGIDKSVDSMAIDEYDHIETVEL